MCGCECGVRLFFWVEMWRGCLGVVQNHPFTRSLALWVNLSLCWKKEQEKTHSSSEEVLSPSLWLSLCAGTEAGALCRSFEFQWIAFTFPSFGLRWVALHCRLKRESRWEMGRGKNGWKNYWGLPALNGFPMNICCCDALLLCCVLCTGQVFCCGFACFCGEDFSINSVRSVGWSIKVSSAVIETILISHSSFQLHNPKPNQHV
jgi:hypothetical protein